MDGVERVMVLGILAVIVAILSFAWSATDESTTPVGALERESGLGGAAIPLSSNTPSGPAVVLGDEDQARLNETRRANKAARDAQQRRLEMMKGGQSAPTAQNNEALLPEGKRRGADKPSQGPEAEQTVETVKPSTHIALKPEAARNEGSEAGSDAPTFRLYTVVSGDSLWGIARRNAAASGGTTKQLFERIMVLNPELEASSLPAGRTIKLPVASLEATAALGAPVPTSDPDPAPALIPERRAAEGGGREYVVGEGDTLNSIASLELGDGTRWIEIYQLNRATIPDPDRIRAGQRLLLPVD